MLSPVFYVKPQTRRQHFLLVGVILERWTDVHVMDSFTDTILNFTLRIVFIRGYLQWNQ